MKTTRKQKNNHILLDYLIIGTGNIAKRHIQNILEKRPESKFLIYKRTNSAHDSYFDENKHLITNTISEVFPINKHSVAIVCSPASHHLADVKKMMAKGFHVFVEKPLLIKNNRISPLIKFTKNMKKLTHVGFNMRFTEGLVNLREIIKDKANGIKNAHIEVCTDFRTWRKNKDYKNTVTFNKDLGGGVINELSHEVDYLIFLFGKPTHVEVEEILNKKIRIDVEHHIRSTFWYKDIELKINLEANMLAKKNKRLCKIDLDDIQIRLNHLTNNLQIIDKKIKNINFKDDINQSYKRELSYFIDCVKKGKESELSFANCIDTQTILNAMHLSLDSRKKIRIQ